MKQQSKLNSEQQQQLASQQTVREFTTADELLRYDAAQTMVPSALAQRLKQSSADIPRPARSWWRRLFGR
jgi:hypothetical protein